MIYDMYQKFKEVSETTNNVEQRMSLLGTPTLTMSDHLWSWSYVRSHAWLRQKRLKYICPVADFINADPRANVDPIGYLGFELDGSANVTVDRPFAAGNELFWNYGMVSNQAFLLYYGFVPKTNEVDYINIPFLTLSLFPLL
eukprot:TRINITY_DN1900_c0_g1_i17.p1 TRINITY_DN1900_c0_g1~~TRINITY_DN1900_c0_g1_i17.p1  ORF type:complete len:142 (+),score=14.65 TRINITY_DN1900_c0_g1_i17:698-1123(+)